MEVIVITSLEHVLQCRAAQECYCARLLHTRAVALACTTHCYRLQTCLSHSVQSGAEEKFGGGGSVPSGSPNRSLMSSCYMTLEVGGCTIRPTRVTNVVAKKDTRSKESEV